MASPIRVYFRLAFALAWGIGGIALVAGLLMPGSPSFSTSSPLYYLAGYSVSLAGIALTGKYEGRAGLRRLAQRLIPWRSGLQWYLAVILGYAAIAGVALAAAAFFQSPSISDRQLRRAFDGLWLAIARDPGPLGEEFGWRGFALPRLLGRYSPLSSSLRLGIAHAVWHLPLFFIPGMPQTQLSFPVFTLGVLSIAVFDTAIYLRTGANLLLAILVHLLANVCGAIALEAQAINAFLLTEACAAALVITAGGLSSRDTG